MAPRARQHYNLKPILKSGGKGNRKGGINANDNIRERSCTLRTVDFSYASRERNHCEQPFDFPLSMCEVRHTPCDVFDITLSYFAGNPYTAGSPKRSSYVAERTRKRQNKFTNSFYLFKFNLFVLGAGRPLTQRN